MPWFRRNGSAIGDPRSQNSNQSGIWDLNDAHSLKSDNTWGNVDAKLASLFNVSPTASTTLRYDWENDYTTSNYNTTLTWSGLGGSNHYISGFGVTTEDNRGRYQGSYSGNLTVCNTASAVNYQTNHTPANANNFGTATSGIWFSSNDRNATNIGYGSFTFNSGLGDAIGIVVQSWGSVAGSYHSCAAVAITCNSITKYFAPKASIRALTSSPSNGGFVLYPTNMTSWSDYANISGSVHVVPSSYFVL